MVTYIAIVYAKHGHEDAVTDYYQGLEESLKDAPGFHERTIFRARAGAMKEVVLRLMPPEEINESAMKGGHGPDGVQFISIEKWDSEESRFKFSRSQAAGRSSALIPHVLPEHSHEYFEDVSVS